MDRLTRHQMKQDDLRITYEEVEVYVREHFRQIAMVVVAAAIIIGGGFGWRAYRRRERAQANLVLAKAMDDFNGYVGSAPAGSGSVAFPTYTAKYKAALSGFQKVVDNYPHTQAAVVARIHAGVCQAMLGDDAGAKKTLEAATRSSDRDLASLARFSLAGELARSGDETGAEKIYQDLAAHPTLAVPEASSEMALADSLRATDPARAIQIYKQLLKTNASDTMLSGVLQQQIASLK